MSTPSPGTLGSGAEFGPYTIIRQVGRGAFGVVYEARKAPIKKRVALKVLHEHVLSSPDAVTRFQREIMAAAQVEHPNVVQVFDGGLRDDRGFLAMEFLEGETLAERLKREKTLSPEEIVDVMVPIASALDAVHNAGVVHRDIKPGNIFLARHVTGVAYPKLVDFGIAKLVSDELDLTQTHSWLGTPFYMSPEQVRQSKAVDARTDQWSLAVVLYEALTGEKPFRAEVLLDLLEAITTRSATAPSEVKPGLPKGLDTVIARMMERDAAKRFPSMRAAGAALWPFASPRVRAVWARHYDREGDPAARVHDVLEARDSGILGDAASLQKTTVREETAVDPPTLYEKVAIGAPKVDSPAAHDPEKGPAAREVHPTWRHMAMGAVLGISAVLGGQYLLSSAPTPDRQNLPPQDPIAPVTPETSPDAAPPTTVTPSPDVAVAPPSPDAIAPAIPDASAPSTVTDAAVNADAPHAATQPATTGGNTAHTSAGGSVRGAPYCDEDPAYAEACTALQAGNRGAAMSAFAAIHTPRALVAQAHLARQSGRLVDAEEKLEQALRGASDAWMVSHSSFTNGLLGEVQARLGSIDIRCTAGEVVVGADGASRRYTLPRSQSVRSPTGHVQVVITNNGISFQQYVDVQSGQTATITTCGSGS
ncbi:MAG: protein kinase [Polyangiales bacterium]